MQQKKRRGLLAAGDSLTAGFVDGGASFYPYMKELQRLMKKRFAKWKGASFATDATCGATIPMIAMIAEVMQGLLLF